MEPLYSYQTYGEQVLATISVQQKTSTAMERREDIVSPWSSMFFVSVLFPFACISICYFILFQESYLPIYQQRAFVGVLGRFFLSVVHVYH